MSLTHTHTHAGGDCIFIHSHATYAVSMLLRKALEHLASTCQAAYADGHIVGSAGADACKVVATATAERSKAK